MNKVSRISPLNFKLESRNGLFSPVLFNAMIKALPKLQEGLYLSSLRIAYFSGGALIKSMSISPTLLESSDFCPMLSTALTV
jgi:hypothetical protein